MSLADDGEMIGVVRTCTKRGVWWEKEEDVRYLPKVRPIVELESKLIFDSNFNRHERRRQSPKKKTKLVEILRYNQSTNAELKLSVIAVVLIKIDK
jgi:hypothetical protein